MKIENSRVITNTINMKARTIIYVTLTVLILITYVINRGIFLKHENTYSISNEKGETINAKIYSRTITSKINDKEEDVYQILVFFDDDNKMKHYNPILFIPKLNMVGIVEGGKKEFLSFGNNMFQKSEKANEFTSLTNSLIFDNNPPINKIIFKDNSIVFNSFEGLKIYGKNLILLPNHHQEK